MAKPEIKDRLIVNSLEEVAYVFEVTKQAVSLWKKDGMPYFEVDGKFSYDLDDILEWKTNIENARAVTGDGHHRNPFINAAVPQVAGLMDKVDEFRLKRADIFALRQMNTLGAQDRIRKIHVDDLTDEQIAKWSTKEALAWYGKFGLDGAIWYDKEQIERNQGVEDVSKVLDVIAKIKEIERGD